MDNTQAKRGRGRPDGSLSFTEVTLAELNAKYKPEDTIKVGRIWLEKGKTPVVVVKPQSPVTPDPFAGEVVYEASEEVSTTPAPEMSLSE